MDGRSAGGNLLPCQTDNLFAQGLGRRVVEVVVEEGAEDIFAPFFEAALEVVDQFRVRLLVGIETYRGGEVGEPSQAVK